MSKRYRSIYECPICGKGTSKPIEATATHVNRHTGGLHQQHRCSKKFVQQHDKEMEQDPDDIEEQVDLDERLCEGFKAIDPDLASGERHCEC